MTAAPCEIGCIASLGLAIVRVIVACAGDDTVCMPRPATQCPGSDVRIILQHARLRTSEPKGHWHRYESSVALDLTFLRWARRKTGRSVKSATLVATAGGQTLIP